MGVKCTHYKLYSVQSKLVYFLQFWGMKHRDFLGPVCDIWPNILLDIDRGHIFRKHRHKNNKKVVVIYEKTVKNRPLPGYLPASCHGARTFKSAISHVRCAYAHIFDAESYIARAYIWHGSTDIETEIPKFQYRRRKFFSRHGEQFGGIRDFAEKRCGECAMHITRAITLMCVAEVAAFLARLKTVSSYWNDKLLRILAYASHGDLWPGHHDILVFVWWSFLFHTATEGSVV